MNIAIIAKIRSQWTHIKKTIRHRIDALILHTHNHYFCIFPLHIGFALTALFNFLFSRIAFEKKKMDELAALCNKGVVIYLGKRQSYLEFLFYHFRLKKEGLPHPTIGFNYRIIFFQPITRLLIMVLAQIDHFCRFFKFPNPYKSGYIKEELQNGRIGYLSLQADSAFHRIFVKAKTDPLKYLVEMQYSLNRPVFIVPQMLVYHTRPKRTNPTLLDMIFGTRAMPGKLRRLFTLIKSAKRIFVEVLEPVNLRSFLNQPEVAELSSTEQSLALRRHLHDQINLHRQSIIGPTLKSREEIKENILTHRRVQSYIEEFAAEQDIPIRHAQKKAESYIEEIAADYSQNWIKLYEITLDFVLKHIFEGMTIDLKGLNRVKQMAKKGPLILVPCHKSHLDYLIISYVFHKHKMPCPHIAAGKNLSFWPLGPIFRGGGAFFLRRTFKGAKLYAQIFAEYVQNLLTEGFNIEFFIEGGRSRTGKLLSPKVGLLSLILDAYKNKAVNDLIFVPINIGYDRVLEEGAYIHEVEGGQKKPENLSQFMRIGKFLKVQYGRVYVRFHEPLSLNDYCREQQIHLDQITQKEQYKMCMHMGYWFINAINASTIVTPHGIVASALLNSNRKRFSHKQMMYLVNTYMNYLIAQNAKFSETLVLNPDHAILQVIQGFIQRKFIESVNEVDDASSDNKSMYKVNETKRPGLEYYKNNCMIFFVPAAFTAIAILEKNAFQFNASDLSITYAFMQDLFINEFAYDYEYSPEYFVRKNIKAFIDSSFIVPHHSLSDTYNITSEGFKQLHYFGDFLKPFLESYSVALQFLRIYPKDTLADKDRSKKIMALGKRMYKRKEIERIESISKMNYKNAVRYFADKGILGSEDKDKIDLLSEKIKHYISTLSF